MRRLELRKRDGAEAGLGRPPLLAALVAGLAGALLVSACGGAQRPTLVAPSRPATTTTAVRPTVRQAAPAVPSAEAIVATATTARVPVFRAPGDPRPALRVGSPAGAGTPLVFLVRSRRPGWEQVYLPVRPDGSTGWVQDRWLRLALDPYSLEVRLGDHEVVLRRRGRVVARFPAGVGRGVLPTPTGRYYVVDLLRQPDPTGPYGPYAFGTSAYSRVLFSFGGGPGEIGIHGTDDASSIGRNASHGCIRLPNAAIRRLAGLLPLGTPVTIVR